MTDKNASNLLERVLEAQARAKGLKKEYLEAIKEYHTSLSKLQELLNSGTEEIKL